MASYKGTYSNEQSLNFVIPIVVIVLLGIIYIMAQRQDSGFASFILIGVAALTMFYWVRHLKKITSEQKPFYTNVREQESKKLGVRSHKGRKRVCVCRRGARA